MPGQQGCLIRAILLKPQVKVLLGQKTKQYGGDRSCTGAPLFSVRLYEFPSFTFNPKKPRVINYSGEGLYLTFLVEAKGCHVTLTFAGGTTPSMVAAECTGVCVCVYYIPQHVIQVLGHHPCQVKHHHG